MSDGDGVDRLHAAAERLDQIALELSDPATTDTVAVGLAREAAQIAAEAGTTAAEAARAASERGPENS